jgi:adenine-specific DNA-methyltransferase
MVKDGRTRACPPGEGWTFRTVTGRSPAGDKVLIVWRTLTSDAERDNAMLDLLFARMDIRPRDQEFDLIYVNGDNNLENLRRPDETWKVRLIEEDFHRLMWDVQDV